MKFFYVTNIFDLQAFDNETTALLNFFEISSETHFISLFFFRSKKYYSPTFDDTFKMYCCASCTLHCCPLNTPFFFRFLIYVYFNDVFVEKFMKKDVFQDVLYYRILGCQTL